MTLAREIEQPESKVFRRAYIKRRNLATGLYETGWHEITRYVKRWGTLESRLDDIALNMFTHSGLLLTVRNDTGAFNHEDIASSLWNGYLTRYRTLVKIECGYEDTDGSDLPTNPSAGIFIMDKEIKTNADSNDVALQCASLRSIFDEVRVRDVASMGATGTASDYITKIKNHTDGSSNFVFQQFITSGAWSIETTTTNYNPATTTSLEAKTCWDYMVKLSQAEGKVVFIDRTGGLRFESRPIVASTTVFDFSGQGFARPTIIRLEEYKEAWNKLYTFFRCKYLEPATSASYVVAGTTTSVDPANVPWKYGARVYEFENDFIPNTATAQGIVDNLLPLFSTVKQEARILTKFAPQIELHDTVRASYYSYDAGEQPLWDTVNWDAFNWAQEGQNFDWFQKTFRVIGKELDLDNFTERFALREV